VVAQASCLRALGLWWRRHPACGRSACGGAGILPAGGQDVRPTLAWRMHGWINTLYWPSPAAAGEGTVTYSPAELIAVSAARKLHDGCSVFAGVGLPLLAGILAKRMHAPSLQMVVEGGIIDPEVIPGRLPYSTNEMRLAPRATMLPGITDTFLLAQRGFLDFGFVSGAQIDRYGNLNSSVIGPHDRPKVRLPGSGGANDIASLCRQTIVLTVHEKRRLVPAVDS